jgi:hypothetical protein
LAFGAAARAAFFAAGRTALAVDVRAGAAFFATARPLFAGAVFAGAALRFAGAGFAAAFFLGSSALGSVFRAAFWLAALRVPGFAAADRLAVLLPVALRAITFPFVWAIAFRTLSAPDSAVFKWA